MSPSGNGWATLGFADGVAEGRGRGAADATPASQPCPRSGSLGEVGSSRREDALPAKPASHPAQLQGCRGVGEGSSHGFVFT